MDFPDVDRAGQVVDDDVEHRLHTLVLERGAAGDRHDARAAGRTAESRLELVVGRGLFREEELHDLIVDFREAFHHVVVRLFTALGQLAGQLLGGHVDAVGGLVEIDRLAFEHVDHALEVGFFADRQHQRNRSRAELALDFGDDAFKIGAGTVHLVDQRDDRDLVLLRLAPDGFSLGLNLAYRAENRNRTVEDAQRTLHLCGEVHVSGSVDDIDTMVFPITGSSSAGDRNSAFALLLHPVHRGSTFVGITDLVVHAGIEENAFRQRGFAGIDVRHDADIAGVLQRDLAVRRLMILGFVYLGTHNRSLFPAITSGNGRTPCSPAPF